MVRVRARLRERVRVRVRVRLRDGDRVRVRGRVRVRVRVSRLLGRPQLGGGGPFAQQLTGRVAQAFTQAPRLG